MAITILDLDGIRILADLINEELDLYSGEDLLEISEASLIIFSHALIIGSLNLYQR